MLMSDSPSLYEKRKGVYPKAVDGFYRRLKWAVMAVTLAIYWGTPWLRWDRGPYAPDQAVLVDLAHRRFYMFSIEIWPHEFYYVAGLLIMAGIGLFLVTSAVGRAWCGYACPQTVWTDLYQHVERFIDGDRNAQLKLAKAPWSAAKLARRLAKWSVWLAIAFITGGAWIFYFADAPTLQQQFWSGTAAPVAYGTVAVLTATTFILGGFMREQVCIYMCPWPRIQTAMLDEKSLVVTYKDWRGEQRGSLKKAQANPGDYGDCIDCNQCVAVCPTGDGAGRTAARADRLLYRGRCRGREEGRGAAACAQDAAACAHHRLFHGLGQHRRGDAVRVGRAHAARHQRAAGSQSDLRAPVRRRNPQQLYGEAAEHGGAPARGGGARYGSSRRKDLDRRRITGKGE